MSGFLHRGLIEGFYGPPFCHEDRLWWIEELGRMGMNRYLYAPKEDPFHRDKWRSPYPKDRLAEFRALVTRGRNFGVEVGFAASPGLSIVYSSERDRLALISKFLAFRDIGTRLFCLALDDASSELSHPPDRSHFNSLAGAHINVANELLSKLGPDAQLWMIPSEYIGIEATSYLEALGEKLDPKIEIAWTGRTVVSPTVELDEAKHRAHILKRRVLLWDNVPVNDGPMSAMLHLGPYTGRAPNLSRHVSGVLLNAMPQARASALCVRTAAEFLQNPEHYDSEAAWIRATKTVGSGAEDAFRIFAHAHRFSALAHDDRDRPLETTYLAYREMWNKQEQGAKRLRDLQTLLEIRLSVANILRTKLLDQSLLTEIEPWIDSHHQETERILQAVELLKTLHLEVPRIKKIQALFRFQAQMRTPIPSKVSYGPRRLLYPQLAATGDNEAGFGEETALFRDQSLAEDFVRAAEDRALSLLRV